MIRVASEDAGNITVIDTTTNLVITPVALAAGADPRDVDISVDGAYAYIPTGDWSGDDGVLVFNTVTHVVDDTVTITTATNSNTLAVAPEPIGGILFTDGFESGDTTGWTTTSP